MNRPYTHVQGSAGVSLGQVGAPSTIKLLLYSCSLGFHKVDHNFKSLQKPASFQLLEVLEVSHISSRQNLAALSSWHTSLQQKSQDQSPANPNCSRVSVSVLNPPSFSLAEAFRKADSPRTS